MADTPTLPLVLITGAAGRIGSAFAAYAQGRYRLRLLVLPGVDDPAHIESLGDVVAADIGDLDALKHAMNGVDACVHLAGDPDASATWDRLLQTNIVGTYNVYAAAKAAGVKRVVYASSIHAVSGYPADVQVKTTEPVNPGDLYGVSKCFGEALGKYMAEQEGVGGVAIRIGAYQPDTSIRDELGVTFIDSWVSPRDLNQLIGLAIDRTDVLFAVVHGLSDNRFKRLDLTTARDALGYVPQDDSTVTNREVRPLDLPAKAIEHSLSDADDPAARSGLRDQL